MFEGFFIITINIIIIIIINFFYSNYPKTLLKSCKNLRTKDVSMEAVGAVWT